MLADTRFEFVPKIDEAFRVATFPVVTERLAMLEVIDTFR